MTLRPSIALAGVTAAVLITVAACGGSATPSPSAAASTAASPSPAASVPASAAASTGTLPSASAAASAGSVADAGTLLTADLAASVIGGSPTSVTPPMSIPNVSIASYQNASGDTVTLFIENVPGGLANSQLQAAISMAGAQGSIVPVSGIGETAGKVVDTNEATVAFVKGSNLVVVFGQSGTASGNALEPKVESVAKEVAGKL